MKTLLRLAILTLIVFSVACATFIDYNHQALRRFKKFYGSTAVIADFQKTVPKNDSDFYYLQGLAYLANFDLNQAIANLQKAVELNSKNHNARLLLGQAYYSLAIFDMIDRKLYQIKWRGLSEENEKSLQYGYLGFETIVICQLFERKKTPDEELEKIIRYKRKYQQIIKGCYFQTMPVIMPFVIFYPDQKTKMILETALYYFETDSYLNLSPTSPITESRLSCYSLENRLRYLIEEAEFREKQESFP